IRTEIQDILVGLLQQHTGQELQRSAPEWQLLNQEIASVQRVLANQEVAQVRLENVLGHSTFKTQIQRSSIEAWLRLKAPSPDYARPPQRCPGCNNLMLDKWTCGSCGVELLSPDVRAAQQTASLDPRGALPVGYFLLADPKRRRVLFVYVPANHEIVWQINFEEALCQEPVSAHFLNPDQILITDRKGHRVFICNRFGRKSWSYDNSASAHHALNHPTKAHICQNGTETPDVLIVDQGNHRVLRVNAAQEIVWSYGLRGQAGKNEGYLDSPSDIQLTAQGHYLITDSGNHRVIEVNPISQKIIWEATPREKLKTPVAALRHPNGRTLILDGGNHRILELDASSNLMEECVYFKAEMDPRFRIDRPLALIRRENQNVLIQNEDRVFEVMLLHKQLQWFSLLTDLRLKHFSRISEIPSESASVKSSAPTLIRSAFNLPDTLKRVSVFQDAPADFFDKIKLCLRFEEHPAGKILVREGQRGDTMYIIRRGTVEVLKDFQVVASLHEGEIFGEMALVLSEPRSATVRTQSTAQLYKLNKLAFESVVQAYPEVYERIKKIAEARRAVSDIKANPEHQGTERLQQLVESHKSRLQSLRDTRLNRPSQMTTTPTQARLLYSPIEQHILLEAIEQQYTPLEVHVKIHPRCRMKSVRISLLVMLLEKHGTVIKMNPSADDILQEKLDLDVSLALVTRSSRSEILEDASSIAEIEEVSVLSINL
ncbi:MAG: cyclic nucleotide-binding domain-containing protein, partial [Candidatus Sericytochromatia bacterium]